MLYLTCTTITSVDLAHYGISRVNDWVSGDCGTRIRKYNHTPHLKTTKELKQKSRLGTASNKIPGRRREVGLEPRHFVVKFEDIVHTLLQ